MKNFKWITISYNQKMILRIAGLSAIGFETMIFEPFLQYFFQKAKINFLGESRKRKFRPNPTLYKMNAYLLQTVP